MTSIAQRFRGAASNILRSLTAKVIISSIVTIAAISVLIWCPSIIHIQKEEFNKSLRFAQSQTALIRRALHYGMLTNNREFLQGTIEFVSKTENFSSIRILGIDNRIYFSSQKSEVGSIVRPIAFGEKLWSIKDIDGKRTLKVVTPILNTPTCYTAACHVHVKEQTVLGVIDSEFSLHTSDTSVKRQGVTIAAFGFAFIVVLTLPLYLIVYKFILKPLSTLTSGIQRVASGDLSHTIEINTKDEVGILADAFNVMTMKLKEKRDIMERELDEYKMSLLQAQKMEAVGRLAGGVAHNLNNILTAIIGYAGITMMKMKEHDPFKYNIEQIIASGERAANLIQRLLAFSRKQLIMPVPIDLNEVIKKVEELLLRVIREDIELKTVLVDRTLIVMADSVQIEQVLMNLAINARDAMPDGGVLTIKTGFEELDEVYAKTHDFECPGTYAFVSVTDTGIGIDEKMQKKIFEPFFTTKEVGKGTGLGLASVFGTIKQHNGNIEVYSEVGKGTTFKIYLLLIEAEPIKSMPTQEIQIKGGMETVLIAEDDRSLQNLMTIVLEDKGYKVITASDGEDAVNKFIEDKDRIDIVILDVIMPKKNGKEAYDEMEKVKKGVKAIFMSGYALDILKSKGLDTENIYFISKPVSPIDLIKKIREVLDRT